jgi:NifU-like protein involved in Fe-S cluster formation
VISAPLASSPIGDGMGNARIERHMAEIDEIYNTGLFELSAVIPRTTRLPDSDATATAHSKLCGSTITVDLKLSDGRVADYGQTVRACLLGQAAASVMGREIIGSSEPELRAVGAQMRRMLKENGPPPSGRWSDLALLEPVRGYRARHASTLLVFDAVEKALDEIRARKG